MRARSLQRVRAATTGLLLVAGFVSLLGCDDSSDPDGSAGAHGAPAGGDPRTIYPLEELVILDTADDPFADHRPQTVTCDTVTGWYREDDGIEVDTASCDYFAARESAVTSARAGELLELTFSHFDLTAPEPAEAHFALRVAGEVLYEEFIAIPGPGAVYDLSLTLPEDIAVGAPLEIHLHNHGQNTWVIGPVTVRAAE